ncbi:hypothetical protein VT84_09550 [Gemmata sp. SH-PL17]|nr:hypothetical protein VT84_09550 [Gemmata sp. SH-PL17]
MAHDAPPVYPLPRWEGESPRLTHGRLGRREIQRPAGEFPRAALVHRPSLHRTGSRSTTSLPYWVLPTKRGYRFMLIATR